MNIIRVDIYRTYGPPLHVRSFAEAAVICAETSTHRVVVVLDDGTEITFHETDARSGPHAVDIENRNTPTALEARRTLLQEADRPLRYSYESLCEMNGLYLSIHTLDQQDVDKVNMLCARMEAERNVDVPRPMEGDRVICLNPTRTTLEAINKHGHLEKKEEHIWIHMDPLIPLLNEKLHCGAGGLTFEFSEEQFHLQAVLMGKTRKSFYTWGQAGPWKHGAILFQCEVFLWKLIDTRFSRVRTSR